MVDLRLYHHLHTPNHLIQQLVIVKSHLLVQFLVIWWRYLHWLCLLTKQRRHSTCNLTKHPTALLLRLSLSKFHHKLVSFINQVLHVVNPVLLIRKVTHHKSLNVWFLFNTKLRMLWYQRWDQLVSFCQFWKTLFFTELAWLFWHQFKYLREFCVTIWNVVIRVFDFAENWFYTFRLVNMYFFRCWDDLLKYCWIPTENSSMLEPYNN